MPPTPKASLEKYKSFPVVAWATVFFFAVFVVTITMKLQAVTTELEVSTSNLEAAMQADLSKDDLESLR